MRYDLQISELTEEQKHKFVLCYVETIPATYNDYDEETYEMINSDEFKEYRRLKDEWYKEYFKEHHSMSGSTSLEWDKQHGYKWKYGYKDYDVEDYVNGNQYYLYFTNDMNKQWGDDWDDAPYEHNAEIPYDDKTDIIRIPVSFECLKIQRLMKVENIEDAAYEEMNKRYPKIFDYEIREPKDYGFRGNSPFSVDMINAQAVPWLWINCWESKKVQDATAIFGGETIEEVLAKINNLNKKLQSI